MTAAHRRHDMSNAVWERLRPHLPGGEGKQGRPAHDNRRFIDAVCWILRTGAPWRDLPPDYGDWKNTHRRFCRWRDRGVWAMLLDAVMDEPDFEWLMIDASYIKAHPHSAGARGGNQCIARTRGGQSEWRPWTLTYQVIPRRIRHSDSPEPGSHSPANTNPREQRQHVQLRK